MPYGYMNKVLKVDLSNGRIVTEALDPGLKRKYLGGMGFGSKILYDEVKPGVDPLGPDNLLIFATSPLTGTLVPSACRIDITFKSPLTGYFGTSNAAGFWGPELKYAGYDMLIVRGKASHPVYIWIDDDKVEIRDASYLWGQGSLDTMDLIKKQFPECYPDRIRVAAIGPAGENLVKFASLTVDYHHSASKCGIGAVMGSKNLKAIAVRGSHRVAVAEPEKFEQAVKDVLRVGKGQAVKDLSRVDRDEVIAHGRAYMHLEANESFLYSGDLPGKNYQVGVVPHWRNLTQAVKKKTSVMFACHVCDHAERLCEVKTGRYAGARGGDVHGSLVRGWGALCFIDNLPAIYKIGALCEELGLDYQSAQHVVGFAMELYQRGIISKETTDGLELEWGNEGAVIELLHKIARREGFGNILAESSTRAARMIGKESEKYAMDVGGMTKGPHEPRPGVGPVWDRCFYLGHLTSFRGGDNVKTTHQSSLYVNPAKYRCGISGTVCDAIADEFIKHYVESLDMPEEVKQHVYGTPPKMDPLAWEGMASLAVFMENLHTAYNMLGTCMSRAIGPTSLARLFSACTGVEVTSDELLRMGHRVFALNWAYNAREGVTLNSLAFPERFYNEPIPEGPAKGSTLSRKAVEQTLAEYYKLRGWDKKTGLPTRRTLEELDLNDVADELQDLGVTKAAAKRVVKVAAEKK